MGKYLITNMIQYSTIPKINTMDANYAQIKFDDIKILMDFFGVDTWESMIKQIKREIKIRKIIDDTER